MATPIQNMPEILQNQSSKYISHNEALRHIDAKMLLSVEDKDLVTSPSPGSGDDGFTWIVAGVGGDWSGFSINDIAHWYDGSFYNYVPLEGWFAYVKDEDELYLFDGSSWVKYAETFKTLKVGDVVGGNYFEIEADGTFVLHGDATVYEDIDISAADFVSPSSGNPDIDEMKDSTGTDTGVECNAYAVGEKVSAIKEIKHTYEEGSNIFFHLHFQIINAPSGTDKLQFQVGYTFGVEGATPAAITNITTEIDVDTQYQFYTATFSAVIGTSINFGDQLMFTFERIAASTAEYSGDALVSTFGIHIRQNTMGSRTPTTK